MSSQAVMKGIQGHLMVVKEFKPKGILIALHNEHNPDRPFKEFLLTTEELQERIEKSHYVAHASSDKYTDVTLGELQEHGVKVPEWKRNTKLGMW